jgi:hypothetical protein
MIIRNVWKKKRLKERHSVTSQKNWIFNKTIAKKKIQISEFAMSLRLCFCEIFMSVCLENFVVSLGSVI